jgi:hypothetical protein
MSGLGAKVRSRRRCGSYPKISGNIHLLYSLMVSPEVRICQMLGGLFGKVTLFHIHLVGGQKREADHVASNSYSHHCLL